MNEYSRGDALSKVIEQLREAVIGLTEVAEVVTVRARRDPSVRPDELAFLELAYQRALHANRTLDDLPAL